MIQLTGISKFVVLIFFTGIICLTACKPHRPNDTAYIYELTTNELSLLKEGDILLRQGYGFVSNLIIETLNEDIPVSHVGLLTVDPLDGSFKVIHTVSGSISDIDGLQEQDVCAFVRDSKPNSLIVVRYRHSSIVKNDSGLISSVARKYLKQRIPFDYNFDFQSSDRFFCTEFIGVVIADVFNDHLFTGQYHDNIGLRDKLGFSVFLDPKRFDIILNHQLK